MTVMHTNPFPLHRRSIHPYFSEVPYIFQTNEYLGRVMFSAVADEKHESLTPGPLLNCDVVPLLFLLPSYYH